MNQIVFPNRNFKAEKFNRIFRIKKFDLVKRHSKEFQELIRDQSSNFKSSVATDARIEIKQKHFRELSKLWIESMIESFDKKSITKKDTDYLILIFKAFLHRYIEDEKKGIKSALLSYGIPSGAIISSAQAGIENALNKVIIISIDMFYNEIENHNDKMKDFQENPNSQKPSTLNDPDIKFTKKSEFNEKLIWEEIKTEFNYPKIKFAKKINFINDKFKRKIIFRDIAQSYYLVKMGCYKPGIILAGGVIEELLKLFLEKNGKKPKSNNFNDYIKSCEQLGLLKSGISKLSHSVREFRNLVHLDNEKSNKHTLSKTAAIGSVSSIFTIADDFQLK